MSPVLLAELLARALGVELRFEVKPLDPTTA
jgi:hypothetical protein